MADTNTTQNNATAATPCALGCGFYGSPLTLNMCSKCHRDHLKRTQQEMGSNEVMNVPVISPASIPAAAIATDIIPSLSAAAPISMPIAVPPVIKESAFPDASENVLPQPAAGGQPKVTKCACCNKRVGLTGFTCKCGGTFCGIHRYSDKHDCSVDYKALGREAVAKANPLVVADKIQKL